MLFTATLQQMAYLFSLLAIGYLFMKLKVIPDCSETVLSKLENLVFMPALVLRTFMNHFTTERIAGAGKLLAGSLALELIVIPLAYVGARLCAKDPHTRNIYWYGLSFSNFAFMGNAIVSALFEDIFLEYIIFVLVLWIFIYLWGVPVLLMGDDSPRRGFRAKIKVFANPMLICMLLGMIIGLSGITVPAFFQSLVSSTGDCMSPVAMLLTGMTVAKIDIRSVLKIKSIYVITLLRLLVFPLLLLAVLYFTNGVFSKTFMICAVCSLAMPLGLNTIVIPSAFGKDTKVASGMALVSHAMSCLTIPVIFLLLQSLME